MAIKSQIERKIQVALTTEFGHGVTVTVVDRGGGHYVIDLTGVLVDLAREVDPVRLAAAIRDVVRARFTSEEIVTMARRGNTTPQEIERRAAEDYLRELDAARPAADQPTPADRPRSETPRAMMTSAARAAAILRRKGELLAKFTEDELRVQLRGRSIDDLAAFEVDHPSGEAA